MKLTQVLKNPSDFVEQVVTIEAKLLQEVFEGKTYTYLIPLMKYASIDSENRIWLSDKPAVVRMGTSLLQSDHGAFGEAFSKQGFRGMSVAEAEFHYSKLGRTGKAEHFDPFVKIGAEDYIARISPHQCKNTYANVGSQLLCNLMLPHSFHEKNPKHHRYSNTVCITGKLTPSSLPTAQFALSNCTKSTLYGDDVTYHMSNDVPRLSEIDFGTPEKVCTVSQVLENPELYLGNEVRLSGVMIGIYRAPPIFEVEDCFYLIPNTAHIWLEESERKRRGILINSDFALNWIVTHLDRGYMSKLGRIKYTHLHNIHIGGTIARSSQAPFDLEIRNVTKIAVETGDGICEGQREKSGV